MKATSRRQSRWGWSCALAATLAFCPAVADAQSLPPGALPAGGGGEGGPSTLGGTLPGADSGDALASVNPSTGAVSSSFAFDLPPARGGAQPSLALLYSSNSGMGVAGQGWTLNVPSITRKGVAGVPSFVDAAITTPGTLKANDYADDYYIDGKLLVAICTVTSDSDGVACNGGSLPSAEKLPSGGLANTSLAGYTYFRGDAPDPVELVK